MATTLQTLWSCIEMRSKNERRRGARTRARTHKHTRAPFSLSLSLQCARKHKHSHVMMEFAPSLAGRTIARWRTSTRTHSQCGVWTRSRRRPSSQETFHLGDAFGSQHSEEYGLFSAARGGGVNYPRFLQMGSTCARKTSAHFSPQWLSDPLRSKHAGANQHFGLRGPHKRGYVFSRDVKFSVQNERLSEHSIGRGGGERGGGEAAQRHAHLCVFVIYLSIMRMSLNSPVGQLSFQRDMLSFFFFLFVLQHCGDEALCCGSLNILFVVQHCFQVSTAVWGKHGDFDRGFSKTSHFVI